MPGTERFMRDDGRADNARGRSKKNIGSHRDELLELAVGRDARFIEGFDAKFDLFRGPRKRAFITFVSKVASQARGMRISFCRKDRRLSSGREESLDEVGTRCPKKSLEKKGSAPASVVNICPERALFVMKAGKGKHVGSQAVVKETGRRNQRVSLPGIEFESRRQKRAHSRGRNGMGDEGKMAQRGFKSQRKREASDSSVVELPPYRSERFILRRQSRALQLPRC